MNERALGVTGSGGATEWIGDEFSGIDFQDKRLELRLLKVAERLSLQPQSPINQACADWAATKAAYRLFDNEKVGAEEIFAAHQARTRQRLVGQSLVLGVQDTTYLNYSTHAKAQGLGPIGDSLRDQQGLIMHSTLAVTPSGLPLGLLTQEIWARDGYATRRRGEHKKQPIEEKESYKWLKALWQTGVLANEDQVRIVTICDREADVYEFLAEAVQLRRGFVVRAAWNRGVAQATRLWEQMQAQPVAGQLRIDIPARDHQPAREAVVQVRFAPMRLRPPQRHSSIVPTKLPALSLYAVFVTELVPPADSAPLEWMLLTNVSVNTFDEALERLSWYQGRWPIEEFHKVLKSGCRVEACRLQTAERLIRYVTLCSVIAWRLYWLTHINRADPDAPATTILAPEEIAALQLASSGSGPSPEAIPTVCYAVRLIAKLGGFLGRKHDGEPGITAIWRGWQRLSDFTLMWSLANASRLMGNS